MEFGDPLESDRVNNTLEAASPQAIVPSVPPKLPLSSNDPTRNVSPAAGVGRIVLLGLAVLSLVVLAIATATLLVESSA